MVGHTGARDAHGRRRRRRASLPALVQSGHRLDAVRLLASHVLRDPATGTAPLLQPLPSMPVKPRIYYAGGVALPLLAYALSKLLAIP